MHLIQQIQQYREILMNDDLLSHVTDYINKHITIVRNRWYKV